MNTPPPQNDNQSVLTVIDTMRRVAFINYGALAIALLVSIIWGLATGNWQEVVVSGLIAAVSNGAGSASGFMSGVLSQTRSGQRQSDGEPQPIETPRMEVTADEVTVEGQNQP